MPKVKRYPAIKTAKVLRRTRPLLLNQSKIDRLIKMRLSGKYTFAAIAAKFSISHAAAYSYWKKFKPNKLKK